MEQKGKKEYSESQVLNDLRKKQDIEINGKVIRINRGDKSKGDIGIKTKGKIDFLVNYKNYILSAA